MRKPTRLTAAFVRGVREPGRYGDGGRGSRGLSLLVRQNRWDVSKLWQQRVRVGLSRDGDARYTTLSIGQWPDVSLDAARDAAFENHRAARSGELFLNRPTKAPTFAQAVEEYVKIHAPGWRSAKTEKDWRQRLAVYCFPVFGHLRLDQITTAHVVAALRPIWERNIGQKVASYVTAVMAWGVAAEHTERNVASRELLAAHLPRAAVKVEHHAALPWADVPAMLDKVRASGASEAAKGAIEMLALTAARSGEVRAMTWEEVDLDSATWTMRRTKNSDPHRVALSTQAVSLLRSIPGEREGLVFPSRGKMLHEGSLSKRFLELGIPGTIHGLRSSFRDWCAEHRNEAHEVCEAALGHRVGGKVVVAYRRTDYLDARRDLMQAWADAIAPEPF